MTGTSETRASVTETCVTETPVTGTSKTRTSMTQTAVTRTVLADALRADCEACAAALPPGAVRTAVAAVAERLAEPVLRVAVGGRLNAGKSTLVNALLGQRLAPTHRDECTMVSAAFVFGYANQVVVHLRDGRTQTVAGRPGGGVPDRLPHPREDIDHLTVLAVNRRLDSAYVFVDTPGRDALSGLDDYAMRSVADADALILVMPRPGEGEKQALEEYVAAVAGTHLSASNVIGVLSRIDELGAGDESPAQVRAQAVRVADRAMRHLGPMVAEIVPVAGLVAQTARGADFTERHMLALRQIAAADPRPPALLYAPDFFLDQAPASVPRPMREELLALLGLFGLRVALAEVDAGTTDTEALLAALAAASGVDRLLDAAAARFLARADPLRTNSALSRLEAVLATAAPAPALSELAARVREWRRRPELRTAELAAVARAAQQGVLPLDDDATAALHLLLSGDSAADRLGLAAGAPPQEVAAEAHRRALLWRAMEGDVPRRSRPHVVLVREMYEQLHRQSAQT